MEFSDTECDKVQEVTYKKKAEINIEQTGPAYDPENTPILIEYREKQRKMIKEQEKSAERHEGYEERLEQRKREFDINNERWRTKHGQGSRSGKWD